MALDDYAWLMNEAAAPWLALARQEISRAHGATIALVSRLRKELSADRAHLVIEQSELRLRARDKFSLAEQMFFTRKGLEQATDEAVAAFKATRFPSGRVADLCCGIGGDAIALAIHAASRGIGNELAAVELDPILGVFASANLRACGSGGAAVTVADATMFPIADFAAWHIDPDRRPERRRTSRVELFAPPMAAIERLRAHNPHVAIKLAPAAAVPDEWVEGAELCWLGSRGECRQQVAWFGALAQYPGRRSATIVDARGGPRTILGSPDEPISVASRLGRFLYEPHAAVLAARLEGTLCRDGALAAISRGVAYFTSDALVDEPAVDAFEIVDVLPLDHKRLKGYFRQHEIGRLEVKKRGVDIDPQRLRKAVIGEGEGAGTLIVCRCGSAVKAIITKRVEFNSSA
jgi:hypothetical protein